MTSKDTLSSGEHWAVEVYRNGESVVVIESNGLSGREISANDEHAIRRAAHHLLGFIGDGIPSPRGDSIGSSGGLDKDIGSSAALHDVPRNVHDGKESERFTTGPWRVQCNAMTEPNAPNNWRVFQADDASYEATICELWSGEHDNEANARLIALAPEMFGVVSACAAKFREYERLHAAKGNLDGDVKARANCEMAEMCEAVIAWVRP